MPPAAHAQPGVACGPLASYLTSKPRSGKQDAEIRDLVGRLQVAFVQYTSPRSDRDPDRVGEFARSIQASDLMPMSFAAADGKTYPRIHVVFSRLFGDARDMPPSRWIKEMKRPLAKGYVLSSLRVVFTPPESVRKRTQGIAQAVVQDVAARIAGLKSAFPELASFEPKLAANSKTGIYFTEGVLPGNRLEPPQRVGTWCEIRMDIRPISGAPASFAIAKPGRTFLLQATEATWWVKGSSPELERRLTQMIAESLEALDAYERALALGQPSQE